MLRRRGKRALVIFYKLLNAFIGKFVLQVKFLVRDWREWTLIGVKCRVEKVLAGNWELRRSPLLQDLCRCSCEHYTQPEGIKKVVDVAQACGQHVDMPIASLISAIVSRPTKGET
jgi:hypothetical protein